LRAAQLEDVHEAWSSPCKTWSSLLQRAYMPMFNIINLIK